MSDPISITASNVKLTHGIVAFLLMAVSVGMAYQSLVGKADAADLTNSSQQAVLDKLVQLQTEALIREAKRDAEITANTVALSQIKEEQKELREEVEESNEDQQAILVRILDQLEKNR